MKYSTRISTLAGFQDIYHNFTVAGWLLGEVPKAAVLKTTK
jgi:hypothetical protein